MSDKKLELESEKLETELERMERLAFKRVYSFFAENGEIVINNDIAPCPLCGRLGHLYEGELGYRVMCSGIEEEVLEDICVAGSKGFIYLTREEAINSWNKWTIDYLINWRRDGRELLKTNYS